MKVLVVETAGGPVVHLLTRVGACGWAVVSRVLVGRWRLEVAYSGSTGSYTHWGGAGGRFW